MHHKIYHSVLPISLIAALSLSMAACGGGDDDDDDDSSASPTPTAQEDTYRVTAMRIGGCDPDQPSSCEGLDLDADGSVDNNFELTLEAMSTSIYTQLDLAMDEAGVPETPQTCPDEDGDGSPDQCLNQQQVLNQLQPMLDQVLSVDAWSQALDTGIGNGDLHYILDFEASGNGEKVVWYTGTFEEVGIQRGGKIGEQIDAEGDDLYGPGDLTLTITRSLPDGTVLTLPLQMTQTFARVSGRSETAISDLTLGGAVRVEDMLVVLEQAVNYINTLNDAGGVEVPGPITPSMEEELMTRATAAIAVYGDIDLDGDGEAGEAQDIDGDGDEDGDPDDGISIGFISQASLIDLLD